MDILESQLDKYINGLLAHTVLSDAVQPANLCCPHRLMACIP